MKRLQIHSCAGTTSRHASLNRFTINPIKHLHISLVLCALMVTPSGFALPAATGPANKPAGPAKQEAPAAQQKTTATTSNEVAGVYTLATIDGKTVPHTLSHDGASLEIRSGSFTITADGKCVSKMTFVPPSGTETTLERNATYTREGTKLSMQWQGAGRTQGSVSNNIFTMNNEGMVLVYKK